MVRFAKKIKSYFIEKEDDIEWAERIMEGGYILHFRHAERQKWIDVEMYDALESDVHDNGFNNSSTRVYIHSCAQNARRNLNPP